MTFISWHGPCSKSNTIVLYHRHQRMCCIGCGLTWMVEPASNSRR